ncbi:MAG: copper homeostasis protein [Saprospiraceae bacterium]|jgi:copper homeostasis protein
MILEACVGNLNDALSAQQKGAHQIELCDRLDLDGNSPSLELIKTVTSALSVPVKIIVNPKPFDYTYDDAELADIKNYIQSIIQFNIAGLVFGSVDSEGMPDLNAIKVISKCTDLPITFHKAIDTSPNMLKAIQLLIGQDIVKYILTSGGAKTAELGIPVLSEMAGMLKRYNSPIQLIGAGRITDKNLHSLHDILSLNYYHGKLIVGEL